MIWSQILKMSVTVLIFILIFVVATGRHPDPPKSMRNLPPINLEEFSASYWINEAREAIEERKKYDPDQNVARNLILFLGDGMSVPTLTAARILKGQNAGKTGEETKLFFEKFPGVGLAKTYCVDHQIADSTCTATAYLCGVKNNYGTAGVTAAVSKYDCNASLVEDNRVQSIAEWALANGRDVGIVTNTRVTHASPSGAYAKTANRHWENDAEVAADFEDPEKCRDIAHQLINMDPGKQFKVILGGGRREFIPTMEKDEGGASGRRTDGHHLIKEWKQDKADRNLSHAYVWNREQLMSKIDSPPEYLLGLFANTHMDYRQKADPTKDPSLEEMTEIAIRMLSRNVKGFFLFVESGRIDHAHHSNLAYLALDETLELEKAVKKASDILPEEDTLMVVTADHSHVLAFNGYTARGSPIEGLSDQPDSDDIPLMTMSYTNGPGARRQINGIRPDVREESDFGDITWQSHAEMPMFDETHGGDDVAVFARGPHSRMFVGLYEQSQIPHLMAYAGCIGPGIHADGCNSATTIQTTAYSVLLATVIKCIFY